MTGGEVSVPRIGLFAIGDISVELLGRLSACLEERFLFKFTVEAPLPLPAAAYNISKKQYFAPTILKKIKISPASHLLFAVGLTPVDLYGTDMNFMYGAVNRQERIAIVSTHRLQPEYYGHPASPELHFARLLKEFTQQLVHCMGGKNCYSRTCVMYVTKNVYEIDSKDSLFCYDCEKKIRQLTTAEQQQSPETR